MLKEYKKWSCLKEESKFSEKFHSSFTEMWLCAAQRIECESIMAQPALKTQGKSHASSNALPRAH